MIKTGRARREQANPCIVASAFSVVEVTASLLIYATATEKQTVAASFQRAVPGFGFRTLEPCGHAGPENLIFAAQITGIRGGNGLFWLSHAYFVGNLGGFASSLE